MSFVLVSNNNISFILSKNLNIKKICTITKNIELGCAYIKNIRSAYFKNICNNQSAAFYTITAYNTGSGNLAKPITGKILYAHPVIGLYVCLWNLYKGLKKKLSTIHR